MMGQRDDRQKALQWRVILTIAAAFAWMIFVVLWLFFVTDLDATQNLAVFLVSVIILVGLLTLTWATWGLRYPGPYVPPPGYGPLPQPRWKGVVRGIGGIAFVAFLVIWLFFYADMYSIYQNIGAILAAALIAGGVTWAITQAGRF
jgi:magnesium-transporting ATPase (P-type)